MHALKLNRRVLDSLHALRMEPVLRLLSTSFLLYEPRTKALQFRYTADNLMLRLVLAGHQPMAITLRSKFTHYVTLHYTGNQLWVDAVGQDPAGNEVPVDLTAAAPGIDVALSNMLLPEIEKAVDKASRYVGAFTRLVYASPELLLSASRNGITYRVRTDTPIVDQQLLVALDDALSKTNCHVITMRIVRLTQAGKTEVITAPQVVSRSQPHRPLAIKAINEHFGMRDSHVGSNQGEPPHAIRSSCTT